jgi:hypothetical protein
MFTLGKHIATHDAIQNIFASIAKDDGFRVSHEQTHVFSSTSVLSSHWHVNIVFATNGVCTLTHIIIINPIQTYLVL